MYESEKFHIKPKFTDGSDTGVGSPADDSKLKNQTTTDFEDSNQASEIQPEAVNVNNFIRNNKMIASMGVNNFSSSPNRMDRLLKDANKRRMLFANPVNNDSVVKKA